MPEGLNPRGGDAYTDVTRGRLPKVWPEDYDRIARSRADGEKKEATDENDPLSILIAQEEETAREESISLQGRSERSEGLELEEEEESMALSEDEKRNGVFTDSSLKQGVTPPKFKLYRARQPRDKGHEKNPRIIE